MQRGKELDIRPEFNFDPVEFTHFDCWGVDDDGEPYDNTLEIQIALLESFEKLTGKSFQHIRDCETYVYTTDFLADCTPILLDAGFDVYDSDTCYEVWDISRDGVTLGEVHSSMTFTQYQIDGKAIATTHASRNGREGLIDVIFTDGSSRLSIGDTLKVEPIQS